MDWIGILSIVCPPLVRWVKSRKAGASRLSVHIDRGPHNYGGVIITDVRIRAQNVSQETVCLSGMGFRARRRELCFTDFRRKYGRLIDLRPGEWWDNPISEEFLAECCRRRGLSGRVPVIGYVVDNANTMYKSKPFEFDIGHFATGHGCTGS